MTTASSAVIENAAPSKMKMSASEKAALGELRKKPAVAWPTVILLFSVQAVVGVVWYLVLTGQMSLWLGCLINIVAYYGKFTPAHDSMHKAVSRHQWVNDWILYQTMFTYLPFNSGKLLGLMHMQHHRFANDDLDPDHDVVMRWYNVFFLWFFWDIRYIFFYLKNRAHYPDINMNRIYIEMVVGFGLIGILALYYPMEVLWLWFIPSRMMGWLICLVFMYLPHVPHTIKDKDDPYKATLIREGWEWLLTPLMMYQNFHLVHHLYPTIPFYRYKKAWLAAKSFHESHDPAIVRAFELHPYTLETPAAATAR